MEGVLERVLLLVVGARLEHERGGRVAHHGCVCVGDASAAADRLLVSQVAVQVGDLLRASELMACIGELHLIHDFKIAIVLGQVQVSIAKAFLRMVPVLDLNIVSVRPVENMLVDDSLLGLWPLVGVQLVEIADLLAQRLLVDEGLLPRVPLRSGLQSVRRPSFGLARSCRVWMVP